MAKPTTRSKHKTQPLLPLALSMGDPAGVGPDIVLAVFAARKDGDIPPFVLYADPDLIKARADALGLAAALRTVTAPDEAITAFKTHLPIHPVTVKTKVRAGHPDTANAGAIIASIEAATSDVIEGRAGALVTNPIAKATLYAAGFTHPGHTEFLASLAERHRPRLGAIRPGGIRPIMMLAAEELRVVPLTVHMPLKDVAGAITPELINETARITFDALTRDFGIASPRIAIAGLNPHAGEDGTMGLEDRDVIAPSVAALKAEGLRITGPHPADTLFHEAARARYDAVIAMYHDQALIPLKTLAFDRGVNVTLGLPFIRTSPDHGTAFDIAGSGRANPRSLIEALRLARVLAARRAATSGAAEL